jgi:hypothetical protein
MRYLNGSRELVLTLEADDTQVIKWWIDGSYATHHDMRSHTGASMSMGKGTSYTTSIKQKLNTKSSTEAKLVAVNDVLPQVYGRDLFWMLKAMTRRTPGYTRTTSAPACWWRRTGKHQVAREPDTSTSDISSSRTGSNHGKCPTGIMTADLFTKPLQGSQFRKFRDKVMNIK